MAMSISRGQLYNPDVRFGVQPVAGGQDYKQCDGCHKISTAMELTLPSTLYYNGKELETRYERRWYCPECMAKLREAVRA
jgi:hypothetical protein